MMEQFKHWNQQVARWADQHPWRYAGALGLWIGMATLFLGYVGFAEPIETTLPIALALGVTWFLLWGAGGWLKQRSRRPNGRRRRSR